MNARDDLADHILRLAIYQGREGDVTTAEERDSQDYLHCQNAADAILAAGYVKPRTITTVEELAELDGGTIIRAVKSEHNPHGLCFEKYGKEWLALDPADREDGEVTIPHTAVLRFYGAHSITVLFTPDEGQA